MSTCIHDHEEITLRMYHNNAGSPGNCIVIICALISSFIIFGTYSDTDTSHSHGDQTDEEPDGNLI